MIRTIRFVLPAIFAAAAVHPAMSQTGRQLVDLDFLFVSAHPDDEGSFTGTMARYVLDEGFRGSVVVHTLGEGGGNATGPELGSALGLIRYEEMRRSLATVGVDYFYFIGLDDFHYTSSAEETHARWSSQNPDYLCDVIRVVRLTRPEVLVTMWPGPGTHGHHQLAARSAVRAFEYAGDPDRCTHHFTEEYLEPWQPLKMYVAPSGGQATLSVPIDEYSPSAAMTYADLKALALRNYRSQGWDRSNTIPSSRTQPERRLLLRSLVPVNDPETHLLEGTHLPAGASPPGIRLDVVPGEYHATTGTSLSVRVVFANETTDPVTDLRLLATAPAGGERQASSPVARLEPGARYETSFSLPVPTDPDAVGTHRLRVDYEARQNERTIGGSNFEWIEIVPPVRARFEPLGDVAAYAEFVEEVGMGWLLSALPVRVPLTTGESNPVTVEVVNAGDGLAQSVLEFDLPDGITADGPREVTVPARSTVKVPVALHVRPEAVPADRQSAALQGTVYASVADTRSAVQSPGGGDESRTQGGARADLFLLPALEIPALDAPLAFTSDLSGTAHFASGVIGHRDVWQGSVRDEDDVSGRFHTAYDDEYLYVVVDVRDDVVLCHMPPTEIRNHWHADAVEILVDPSGDSIDPSSTFKIGIFPCTMDGFGARAARDADARPGIIEVTAPATRVASQRTDEGYVIEARLAWADMPARPRPGDTIGFNVLIYDADDVDAEPGAHAGKSRSGWASVRGDQQSVPYLWPRVRLGTQ